MFGEQLLLNYSLYPCTEVSRQQNEYCPYRTLRSAFSALCGRRLGGGVLHIFIIFILLEGTFCSFCSTFVLFYFLLCFLIVFHPKKKKTFFWTVTRCFSTLRSLRFPVILPRGGSWFLILLSFSGKQWVRLVYMIYILLFRSMPYQLLPLMRMLFRLTFTLEEFQVAKLDRDF